MFGLDEPLNQLVQILRAGTYELLARPDVSKATVISEYVDVAHAFFDEREAKFVLLDPGAQRSVTCSGLQQRTLADGRRVRFFKSNDEVVDA